MQQNCLAHCSDAVQFTLCEPFNKSAGQSYNVKRQGHLARRWLWGTGGECRL